MAGAVVTGVLAAYGHSWVFATGASSRDRGFAPLAARALGLELDNHGVSGSMSTDTARLVVQPPAPARVYVVMTGVNDARWHGPTPAALEAYAGALTVVLEALRTAGPTAPILVVEQPPLVDYAGYERYHRASDAVVEVFNATLREVAAAYAARALPVPGWHSGLIAADGVHPNDAGHRHLAQVVVEAAHLDEAVGVP